MNQFRLCSVAKETFMAKVLSNNFINALIIIMCVMQVYAQKDYGVHDPSTIVKENDRYYTFYTSNGVEYAYSTDLCTWRRAGKIFASDFPSWITGYVPGFGGNFWAPDVFYMNNSWHVYYSCSSFGSRQSAIGLATTNSLEKPQWQNKGMVVNTNNSSDHNAIDPAIMRHDGKIWLVYGSFWSGIVITEIDSTTGKPVKKNDLHYIANNDPEAPCVIHHGEYFYLFFNRGKCCDGIKSTYYLNVGRASTPIGPYLDKNGKQTSSGGGTVILKTQGRFIGPGHFGLLIEDGREFMSYHYYDANQNGISKLKISTLSWQDGWPVVNTDFDPCNPAVNIKTEVNYPVNNINLTYSDGLIFFYISDETTIKYQLYNPCGKVVVSARSQKVKKGINNLNLNKSELAHGLYLFVIQKNGTIKKYQKVIGLW